MANTRQCIQCGEHKALFQFDGNSTSCRTCAAATRRILLDCKADCLESPRTQCDRCGRWFVSYWGQFDVCACCAETVSA